MPWWAFVAGFVGVTAVGVALLLLGAHLRMQRHRRRPDVPPMLAKSRPDLRAIDGGKPLTEALDALEVAAFDIDCAANRFGEIRRAQQRGHTPQVARDPETFAGKAERARLAHARLSKSSSAGAIALEPRHQLDGRAKGSPGSLPGAAPAGEGPHHLRGLA